MRMATVASLLRALKLTYSLMPLKFQRKGLDIDLTAQAAAIA